MIVSETDLVPLDTLVLIFERIAEIEKSYSISIDVEDYVSVNVYGEDATGELDINSRAWGKAISAAEEEARDKIDTATLLLREVVKSDFNSKCELYFRAIESQPDLVFPIADWVKYSEFGFEEYHIYGNDIFKYNHEKQNAGDILFNIMSTLKCILEKKDFSEKFNSHVSSAFKNFNGLNSLFEELEKVNLENIYVSKNLKEVNVNTVVMEYWKSEPKLKEKFQYMVLSKAFQEDNVNLDAPLFKQLEKDFNINIYEKFIEMMQSTTICNATTFYLKGEIDSEFKANSFQEEIDVYSGVLRNIFFNLRDIFKKEVSEEIMLKNEEDTIPQVLKALKSVSKFSSNYENKIIEAIKEKIILELAIPKIEEKKAPQKLRNKF